MRRLFGYSLATYVAADNSINFADSKWHGLYQMVSDTINPLSKYVAGFIDLTIGISVVREFIALQI